MLGLRVRLRVTRCRVRVACCVTTQAPVCVGSCPAVRLRCGAPQPRQAGGAPRAVDAARHDRLDERSKVFVVHCALHLQEAAAVAAKHHGLSRWAVWACAGVWWRVVEHMVRVRGTHVRAQRRQRGDQVLNTAGLQNTLARAGSAQRMHAPGPAGHTRLPGRRWGSPAGD
jgi:hypothetical protein